MKPAAKAALDAAKVIELTADVEEARSLVRQQSQRASAAEAEVKTTREQFADLKKRLFNAEAELARLNGYLARVHEDDVVRDGLVEIDDDRGKRMVPKRPKPLRTVGQSAGSSIQGWDFASSYQSDGRKRTHWTDY